MSLIPWVATEVHTLCDCAKFWIEFQSDDYGRIVQTTWHCWEEKSLRCEELWMEFSVLERNTVCWGQDFQNCSSAIQGPIKHVVFLFFSIQELRLCLVKHLTGLDFYKTQVKVTFFLFILSRCQWWKKFRIEGWPIM